MIYRTTNPEVIRKATDPYPDMQKCWTPEQWLEEERNIAITDDAENVGLLVYNKPGIYCGHYFFNSRGKEAVKRVREMITYAFDSFPIQMILGITPFDRPGARWMNRKMGFTSHGVEETENGPCEFVTLTRADFFERVQQWDF